MPITIRYWDHHRAGCEVAHVVKKHVDVQRAIELSWYSYDDSFCTKTASKKCDLYRKAAAVVDSSISSGGVESDTSGAETKFRQRYADEAPLSAPQNDPRRA